MIKVEFDQKSVFTFDNENLTVHVWDHRDGKWDGPVIGQVGFVKFADEWQVQHFQEMLEFMLEKRRKNDKERKDKSN